MSEEDILARIPERWGKYISTGPGWYSIIFDLDKKIAALDPDYTIAQVKEKFGGLRYYLGDIKPEAYVQAEELIRAAEQQCSVTCEECGQTGELRTDLGWIRTLCDTDYQEYNPRRRS